MCPASRRPMCVGFCASTKSRSFIRSIRWRGFGAYTANVPPGTSTRCSSAHMARKTSSPMCSTKSAATALSKLSDSNGSAVASATSNAHSGKSWRAFAIASSSKSIPTDAAPNVER